MPGQQPSRTLPPSRRGFTLVEMVVVVVVGSIILMGALHVITTQARHYSFENESSTLSGTLQGSAMMLAQAFREVSATEGDFVGIGSDSARVREITGGAILCSWTRRSGYMWYGTSRISGTLENGDSIFVFDMAADTWGTRDIKGMETGSAATTLIPACFWGSDSTSVATTAVVRTNSGSDTLSVGTPIRSFVHTTYGLEKRSGEGWLTRRVGTDSAMALAGPLHPDSGMILTFFDGSGSTTTTAADVAAVEIFLRGVSEGRISGDIQTLTDTVRVRVRLRN